MLEESSKLVDNWIIILLTIALFGLAYLLFKIFRLGPKVGQIVSICGIIVFLIAIVICMIAKLDLKMDSKGVSFTYPPFLNQKEVYLWSDIKSIELVKFDAMTEFGGWGNKHSSKFGNGYLTSGKFGLCITNTKLEKTTVTVLDTLKAKEIISLYH